MTTEHDRKEAHRAFAMTEYFKVYPQRNDHTHPQAFNVGFHLGWEAHRDVSTSKLEGEIEMTISAEYRVKTSTGASIHIVNNHLQLQVNQMLVWMLEHPEFAMGMVPRWNELKADQQAFADHAENNHD